MNVEDVMALPAKRRPARLDGAYENACTRFGGVGSIHALESEGGIEAVHDLTRRLLAD